MNPFELLGLPARFDLSKEQVEGAYRELQRALHPDKFVHASATERRMSLSKAIEVNEAYRVLRDELSRADALLRTLGRESRKEGTGGDPAFLMEVMELREALSEARTARDAQAVAKLAASVNQTRAQTLAMVKEAFAQVKAGDDKTLSLLDEKLGRLRYYARFLDEVESIQDEVEHA